MDGIEEMVSSLSLSLPLSLPLCLSLSLPLSLSLSLSLLLHTRCPVQVAFVVHMLGPLLEGILVEQNRLPQQGGAQAEQEEQAAAEDPAEKVEQLFLSAMANILGAAYRSCRSRPLSVSVSVSVSVSL